MKKTNLQAVKDTALNLLMLPIEANTEMAPLIISHPFFNSGISMHPKTREMVNILEDKDSLSEIRAKIREYILEADNVFSMTTMINKPYLRAFFGLVEDWLSEEDYGNLLSYVWQTAEFPSTESNAEIDEMIEWFESAKKEYLMSEDELKKYNAFPEKVNIYRGVNDYIEGVSEKGLSWTISLETAKFFANRFERENKAILKTEIDKSLILAYFEYEDEVIVDYKSLTSVEVH